MAEASTKLQVLNACLLSALLLTTTTMTCSHSRLESRVIELRDMVEKRGPGDSRTGPPREAGSARTPGVSSGVVESGWGGRRAEVLYVEGAVENAPLRLDEKPQPQNDWYVSRQHSPPSSLSYYTTNEGQTSILNRYILGRMMDIDPDDLSKVMPELATSWEVADDHLTYTYHLRKGVQFADGRPFTSADVKFAFDVMRDPAVEADHLRTEFEDVVSLETPDPHTVVVRYRKLYWAGLYGVGFSLRVLNKGWYEEQIPHFAAMHDIAEYSTEPGKPGFGKVFNEIRIPCPGTGPYYLADEKDANDEYVRLVQNPFWFGIQVHPTWYNFTEYREIYISDDIAAFESFRKGEFDVMVVDADRWDDNLSKDPTITSRANYFQYDHVGLGYSFIAWNCRRPPFDDARVRTAMTHLVNRQWIVDELERGRGQVAVLPFKPVYPIYDTSLKPHAYDLQRAKELLAEAGWTDSDGDGVLDRDGVRFEWELKIPSSRDFFVRVSGAIEDACNKVGIRMSRRPLEWATFIQDLDERRFDAVFLYNSFSSPWIDPYDSYHSSADRPRGGNTPGWRDAEVDALLKQMREEFDEQKRIALFHRFDRKYYDAQPETLLTHGLVCVLQDKRFEGVRVRPTGLRFFDFWVKSENVRHK